MATLMADSEPTPAKVFASEVRPPEPIRLAPLPAENTIPPAPLFAELSDPLLVAPTVRPAAPYREAAPVRLPATAAAQRRRRVLVVVGFAVVVLGLAVAAKLQIALWRGQHPASPQAVQTVPVSPPPTRPIADPTPPLVPDPSPPPVAAPVEAPPAPPAPPPVAEPVASPPAPPEVAAAPPAPVAPTPTAVTKPAVVTLVPRAETPSSVTSSTTLIEALRPKGLLMVVSDRKGTIYIDDVKKGSTTDSRPMELLSGVHRVKVVAGGRTKSMEVRVEIGRAHV